MRSAAMTGRDHADPVGYQQLSETDLAIAALVGRYVERIERGEAPCAHDLLTVAAEFGDTAVDELHAVLACYEAMRASEDLAR